jgi:hypothetical protein
VRQHDDPANPLFATLEALRIPRSLYFKAHQHTCFLCNILHIVCVHDAHDVAEVVCPPPVAYIVHHCVPRLM